MIKVGKRILNKLNKLIPCKTQEQVDELAKALEEICYHENSDVYYNQIYWDRELYIDCGGNHERLHQMLIYSGQVMFDFTEDPKYHPGVCVRYKPLE